MVDKKLIIKRCNLVLFVYMVFVIYLILNEIIFNGFDAFKFGWIYLLLMTNIVLVITFIKRELGSFLLILSILSIFIYIFLHRAPIPIVSMYYFVVPYEIYLLLLGIIPGIILTLIKE